jgi:hypothetical protein
LSNITRAAFFAVLISLLFVFPSFSYAGFIYEGDKLINDKTIAKMKEIGDELTEKTGVTIALVTKKHLTKEEFLEIKNRYLKELKAPYVLWIFSRTYMDRKDFGINQMFNSPDLNNKFDKDSLFSPFHGSFTKLLVIKKSKTDPTSAAFLNGYADLTDMIAKSYGITLKSGIGSESKTFMTIIRVLFYLTLLYFIWLYIKKRFLSKGTTIEKTE